MSSVFLKDSLLAKAERAFSSRQYETAEGYLEQAFELFGKDSATVFVKARMLLDSREYLPAVKLLESYLAEQPDSPVALIYLGTVFIFLDEPAKASDCFEKCLEKSPENVLAANYLTLCRFLSGDESAVKNFQFKILHGNTTFAALLYVALYSYVYTDELQSLRDKVKEEAENSDTACAESGESENAGDGDREEAEHADSLPTELPEKKDVHKKNMLDSIIGFFYFLRASHELGRENMKKAIPLFARACELDPGIRRLHFSYGEALLFDKQYDESLKELEISLQEDGETPEVMFYLGKIFQNMGCFAKSRDFFAKAIDKFSKFPEIYFAYGEMALVEGDKMSAFDFFRKACDGDSISLEELLEAAKKKVPA